MMCNKPTFSSHVHHKLYCYEHWFLKNIPHIFLSKDSLMTSQIIYSPTIQTLTCNVTRDGTRTHVNQITSPAFNNSTKLCRVQYTRLLAEFVHGLTPSTNKIPKQFTHESMQVCRYSTRFVGILHRLYFSYFTPRWSPSSPNYTHFVQHLHPTHFACIEMQHFQESQTQICQKSQVRKCFCKVRN